jgi:hypothetical protein
MLQCIWVPLSKRKLTKYPCDFTRGALIGDNLVHDAVIILAISTIEVRVFDDYYGSGRIPKNIDQNRLSGVQVQDCPRQSQSRIAVEQ